MESEGSGFLGLSPSSLAIILLVIFIALYAAYSFYYGGPTVTPPSYRSGFKDASGSEGFFQRAERGGSNPNASEGFLGGRFKTVGFEDASGGKVKEGFGGAARGTGAPDCLHVLPEGGELLGLFTGEGGDDLRELKQIASKLACFKKDLVSPSYIVEATRYQQFVTMHDIEPIAETTGRCFAKTISPRDLELAFDKWNTRGDLLIRRLCSIYRLSPSEVNRAQTLFRGMVRDVKDIARGACLQGEPTIAGKPGPRDAHPFEDSKYENLGEYTGYY